MLFQPYDATLLGQKKSSGHTPEMAKPLFHSPNMQKAAFGSFGGEEANQQRQEPYASFSNLK